jgi:hypothetical protein
MMFSSTPAIVGFNLLTSNLDENGLISHRIMKSSQMQLSQTPCEEVFGTKNLLSNLLGSNTL